MIAVEDRDWPTILLVTILATLVLCLIIVTSVGTIDFAIWSINAIRGIPPWCG